LNTIQSVAKLSGIFLPIGTSVNQNFNMSKVANPGAGHEYKPQPVAWLKRDLLLFANSIGCTADELHFLYELHPNFAAFPTYPIILPFKHTDQEVVNFYARSSAEPIPGIPKFDSRRVVDGERKITFLKPLPLTSTGRRFEVRGKVLGVYDKGKPGTVVETQSTLVDAASGEAYCVVVGSGFFVGQGGWGGPKGPKTVSYNPPADRAPTATYELQTTPTSALLYRLNGDYNPLHATPEPGQQMGFGGAIMHGLFSWNTTCHGLLQVLGGSDPANIKEFQCRFASPVKPGDKLVTQMWRMGNPDKDGFEEVRFVTSIAGGKVCLSNGRALIKVVGQKSKL
jgi:acyl dehydratase